MSDTHTHKQNSLTRFVRTGASAWQKTKVALLPSRLPLATAEKGTDEKNILRKKKKSQALHGPDQFPELFASIIINPAD